MADRFVAGLAVHDLGGADGSPQLVLLHANGDSGLCWPDAVSRWSSRYQLLGVDVRGHGDSPRFTADQLEEPGDVFVDDTIALLEALRARETRLAAIGHSLGGGALTAACGRRRDLVDALVLIDPPWDTPVEQGMRPDLGAERREEVLAYQRDPDHALAEMRAEEPDWPDAERRAWVAAKAQIDLDYLATGGGRPSRPWTQDVPGIDVPTLVVTGDQGVLVGPPTRTVLERIANPHVEVAVIPGAGHYVRQQRTEAFHAVVDPWLSAALTPRD